MYVCVWIFLGGLSVFSRDDSSGQQDDDEDNDEHDHHSDHDQLDVLPPVGARHFLRRLLEVFGLSRKTDEKIHRSSTLCIPNTPQLL